MVESRNSEYVEGSVYRVRLHNFLTYSDAELFPGPRLNLVIGPNGTGKSSIVCALCVGLGGATKVLGRADKMGDFVQHEKESGFTEIELFFKNKNLVIRRTIYRDHRSTWHVNGKDASQNKVKEVLSKAKIQIDNLCQFLPQDKVGDFSRMSPTQLLRATQAAIGNGELAEQQDEIMKMEKENSTSGRTLEATRSRLETKRSENAQRQRDVERIREQEARRTELANLEKKLMWVQFEDQKRQVVELKDRKNELKDRLQKAKSVQFDPLEKLLDEQKEAMSTIRASKKNIAQEKISIEKSLANIKLRVDHAEREESETQAELQTLRDRHRQMRDKLERELQKEHQLSEEYSQLPDESGLRQEMEELNQNSQQYDTQLFELTQIRENNKQSYTHLNNEIKKIDAQQAKLDNEQLQKQKVLQRRDGDCMRAHEWVKNNPTKFRRKVWGPVALEIQVKEKLHAKYLEDTLQNWVLTTFVTECKEDYDVLVKELNEGSRRLGINVTNVPDGRAAQFSRPYSASQLQRIQSEFGMTCYLDEVIKAPDIIHEVLRTNGGIHSMIVGTQATENMVNKGIDVFSTLTSMYNGASFVTPSKKYVSSVSKYGNRSTTTRTNDLREPQYLVASSDNQELHENLREMKSRIKDQIREIQENIDSVKVKEKDLLDAKHNFSTKMKNVREQLRRRQQLSGYIEDCKRKIRNLEAELSRDITDKEEALARKLRNTLKKHVEHLQGSQKMASNMLYTMSSQAEFELKSTTMEHRLNVITRVLGEEEAKLRRLKEDYEDVKNSLLQSAKRAKELKSRAEKVAPLSDFELIFQSLPDDAVELQARIENVRVALAHFRGDLRVVDIYERVQREIEEDEKELALLESNAATQQDRINAIKDPWYTKLKQVVAEVNESFAQYFKDIGCVGEIHLNEDGEISKWGIERRAQFRLTGKMTTMTAEEQSGGEKSVGTIMYLMALQSLTNCPFRVVDEINQGMDIYNERKVFSRITKSSCGSQLPQYFLITPKLITGLHYHPDTKVLVILNGPYNINQNDWDVEQFINKRRRIQ
ncbi:Aste57867_24801 [Aphanomyces stellatus]|uniref:Structural maintenance of chromosomes protein 5 n=1 Tax=Aphanomyces stellatus TaxID=120398 RepID=A0A485LRG0_9STRA|nr:hypothetical protein As57867_024723 [Aphanomyces stellatus]VFU01436.1 Aste57867_24801 [Aphanomyces stellatus]